MEKRYGVMEQSDQEKQLKKCTMEFSSWSMIVKRRRSNQGKENITTESPLSPLGIGAASNMALKEMLDKFFTNIVQVSVYKSWWENLC